MQIHRKKISDHYLFLNVAQQLQWNIYLFNNANKAMADLQSMLSDVKSGKGTLGALLNDRQMYDNLNNASKNLDALMIDLKANPKRYVHFSVFGGGNKKDK